MADQELRLAAQHHKIIIQHVGSPGKDQNLESEVWFLLNAYGFWTIVKSKNQKWNHWKSGVVCIIIRHGVKMSIALKCMKIIMQKAKRW